MVRVSQARNFEEVSLLVTPMVSLSVEIFL